MPKRDFSYKKNVSSDIGPKKVDFLHSSLSSSILTIKNYYNGIFALTLSCMADLIFFVVSDVCCDKIKKSVESILSLLLC